MKRIVASFAILVALGLSGCVIETTCPTSCPAGQHLFGCACIDDIASCGTGEFLYNGVCYRNGSTCDFVNDQDCVNRTQAWWCSPSGIIQVNDCIAQCTPYGMPYACCGYDPTRGDDACLCCADATCGGFSCHP